MGMRGKRDTSAPARMYGLESLLGEGGRVEEYGVMWKLEKAPRGRGKWETILVIETHLLLEA